PSLPGLFVLLLGGLLFPGLPVALGAIRSSNSSTSTHSWSFILFHLLSVHWNKIPCNPLAGAPVQNRNSSFSPAYYFGLARRPKAVCQRSDTLIALAHTETLKYVVKKFTQE